METLKNYSASTNFVVPSDLTAATVTVKRDGIQVGATTAAVISGSLATATIPYSAIVEEGTVEVILAFTYQGVAHQQKRLVRVATPYLELHEVMEIAETDDVEEARTVEAAVRHIINSHTGQEFGNVTEVKDIWGVGSTSIKLPAKLLELQSIDGFTEISPIVSIDNSGWYLNTPRLYLGIKNDISGYENIISYGQVTLAPQMFVANRVYKVGGRWGYESVPDPVREAAKLLINDYACQDSVYRDRYIQSMVSADWRLQFSSGAFDMTGNVRADQLLSDFVLNRGWFVV